MKDFSLPGGVASRRMTDPCGMLVGKAVSGKYVPRALIRPCCRTENTGYRKVIHRHHRYVSNNNSQDAHTGLKKCVFLNTKIQILEIQFF